MGSTDIRRDDFEGLPVPLSGRRTVLYPALVWSGFTAAFVCVVIGNRLQIALGTIDALVAAVLGNWVLFVYSAAIGFACGRWGLDFQLTLKIVFGRLGAVIPGLLLAVLVTGWFAYQLMLTVDVFFAAIPALHAGGWPLAIIGVGAIFAVPVIVGRRHGFAFIATAFPAMLIFAAICIVRDIAPVSSALLDGPLQGRVPFAAGVSVAFGTFVVSGTMIGDFVRSCRTGNEAVQATAIGFLCSNLPFIVLGVLIGASGHEVTALLAAHNSIAILLLAITLISNWASCDACLANGSMTLKSAFRNLPWTFVSAGVALIGIAAALDALITNLFEWILILSVIVPPVGGIIITDYYVVRVHQGFARGRDQPFNFAALIALVAGILVALAITRDDRNILAPLIGIPVSGVLYLGLSYLAPRRLGVELARDGSGAEAID
jgi:cytosine permease